MLLLSTVEDGRAMKHRLFLLSSLSYCLSSYAAEASSAKLGKPVKADQISQALKSGAILTTNFHNVKSPAYCIGVAGGNTKNRAYIKQGVCSNAARDQVWPWEPVSGPGSDYVVLKNANNRRLCLGVEHGSRGACTLAASPFVDAERHRQGRIMRAIFGASLPAITATPWPPH
jgi:hypothetical protein